MIHHNYITSAKLRKPKIFRYLILFFILSSDIALALDIPFFKLALAIPVIFFLPGILFIRIFENKFKVDYISIAIAISLFFVGVSCAISNYLKGLTYVPAPLHPYLLLVIINIIIMVLILISNPLDFNLYLNIMPHFDRFNKSKTLFFIFLNLILLSTINYFFINSRYILFIYILIAIILLCIFVALSDDSEFLARFSILSISYAILLSNAFLSPFIFGGDIHFEYSAAENILRNGITWDPTVVPESATRLNAVIPVVLMAPNLAALFKLPLLHIFLLIYPFLLLLIPQIVFSIYRNFYSIKLSLFSVFFLIFIPIYVTLLPRMIREIYAILFFACIIYVISNKEINKMLGTILLIIFTFSLSFSHYGIPYILLFMLAIYFIVYYIIKNFYIPEISNYGLRLSYWLLLLISVISIGIFISDSYNFNTFIHLASSSIYQIDSSYNAMSLPIRSDQGSLTFIQSINLLIYLFLLLLIGMLICYKVYKKEINQLMILGIAIYFILPIFLFRNPGYEITRILFIFFILGSPLVIESVCILAVKLNSFIHLRDQSLLLYIFLSLFFIFQNGVVSEVVNDVPISYSISYEKMAYTFTFIEDVYLAHWLACKTTNIPIAMDLAGYASIHEGYFGNVKNAQSKYDYHKLSSKPFHGYLAIRRGNALTNSLQIMGFSGFSGQKWVMDISEIIKNKSRDYLLYNNGSCKVYNVIS